MINLVTLIYPFLPVVIASSADRIQAGSRQIVTTGKNNNVAVTSIRFENEHQQSCFHRELHLLQSTQKSKFFCKLQYADYDDTTGTIIVNSEYGTKSLEGARPNAKQLQFIAACLLKALHVVHSHRLVLLGLSADSVLVTPAGHVKVRVSFGNAVRIGDDIPYDVDVPDRIASTKTDLWLLGRLLSQLWFGSVLNDSQTGSANWHPQRNKRYPLAVEETDIQLSCPDRLHHFMRGLLESNVTLRAGGRYAMSSEYFDKFDWELKKSPLKTEMSRPVRTGMYRNQVYHISIDIIPSLDRNEIPTDDLFAGPVDWWFDDRSSRIVFIHDTHQLTTLTAILDNWKIITKPDYNTFDFALYLIKQVVDAIDKLHEFGILHLRMDTDTVIINTDTGIISIMLPPRILSSDTTKISILHEHAKYFHDEPNPDEKWDWIMVMHMLQKLFASLPRHNHKLLARLQRAANTMDVDRFRSLVSMIDVVEPVVVGPLRWKSSMKPLFALR